MTHIHKLLLLAGDGIGPDIIAQAEKVLATLADMGALAVDVERALIGGVAIDQTGTPLPKETEQAIGRADGVLLGAVGGPQWDALPKANKPETGLLTLRTLMGAYANIRPARVFPQLVQASSLRPEIVQSLDMVIVRELTGGIYFGHPRGIEERDGQRVGINTEIYSEQEIQRIVEVACRIATERSKKLCLVDKANVLESSVLWREVAQSVVVRYPEIEFSALYVDNAAMQMVKDPTQFDVIVTNNIFGDILSDLAAQVVGSIGLLASASLGDGHVGLYEPIHGSAPDIAGTNKANPLATILSLALCVRHSFANEQIACCIEHAVQQVLDSGYRTVDIATVDTPAEHCISTEQMGDQVCTRLGSLLI